MGAVEKVQEMTKDEKIEFLTKKLLSLDDSVAFNPPMTAEELAELDEVDLDGMLEILAA